MNRTKIYDTSVLWASSNPVLANGVVGIESDTQKFKLGDGIHNWNDLLYFSLNSSSHSSQVQSDWNATSGVAEILNKPYLPIFNPFAQAGFNISVGQPVYLDNSGYAQPAINTSLFSSKVIGLAISDANIGFPCYYTNISLSLSDWTNVIGTTNLSINQKYYLDSTVGQLTTNPTITIGQVVILVGEAISTTELQINIGLQILL